MGGIGFPWVKTLQLGVGGITRAAWSSVHAWLLRLRTGSDFAPERLPAPDPVLHVSAPVRRGAVADARLGLAWCPIFFYFFFETGNVAEVTRNHQAWSDGKPRPRTYQRSLQASYRTTGPKEAPQHEVKHAFDLTDV